MGTHARARARSRIIPLQRELYIARAVKTHTCVDLHGNGEDGDVWQLTDDKVVVDIGQLTDAAIYAAVDCGVIWNECRTDDACLFLVGPTKTRAARYNQTGREWHVYLFTHACQLLRNFIIASPIIVQHFRIVSYHCRMDTKRRKAYELQD